MRKACLCSCKPLTRNIAKPWGHANHLPPDETVEYPSNMIATLSLEKMTHRADNSHRSFGLGIPGR